MRPALALCGLVLLSAPALAGDLIPELVPAEARWLAHLDVEALQRSALFQAARDSAEDPGLEEGLEQLRNELGVDPLEILRSVTVFGRQSEPETGVAVFVVGEAAEALLAKLEEQPSYRPARLGGRELHSWCEGSEEKRVYAYVRRFEGVANRLVYVSNRQEEILRSIEVLEGERPGITESSERRMSARPQPGSIFYVETSEMIPGLDDVAQISAVAALANGLRLDVGETNGQLTADLVVTAKNAGDAQNIHSVLQGVSALAGLIGGEHGAEGLRELVQSLRFATNGNEVGVGFRFDSRRLLRILHELDDHDD